MHRTVLVWRISTQYAEGFSITWPGHAWLGMTFDLAFEVSFFTFNDIDGFRKQIFEGRCDSLSCNAKSSEAEPKSADTWRGSCPKPWLLLTTSCSLPTPPSMTCAKSDNVEPYRRWKPDGLRFVTPTTPWGRRSTHQVCGIRMLGLVGRSSKLQELQKRNTGLSGRKTAELLTFNFSLCFVGVCTQSKKKNKQWSLKFIKNYKTFLQRNKMLKLEKYRMP